MDKGMKKSALCETGRVPGGLRAGIKRVFSINSHTTNADMKKGEIQNFYNYDKMTLKNAVTKGVKAWRDRRVGYWLCIDPKTGEYYLLTSAALAELNGLRAMYRLPAVYYRIVLMRDWNRNPPRHVRLY